MKLWIDDMRQPPRDEEMGGKAWVWVKTSKDAIEILSVCHVTEMSFDHDLGEEDNGYKVAAFLEEIAPYRMAYLGPIKWHIHSQNPVGRERIRAAMESAERMWVCS